MAHITADGSRRIHFHLFTLFASCTWKQNKSNMVNGKNPNVHMAILFINKNVNKKLNILHIYSYMSRGTRNLLLDFVFCLCQKKYSKTILHAKGPKN